VFAYRVVQLPVDEGIPWALETDFAGVLSSMTSHSQKIGCSDISVTITLKAIRRVTEESRLYVHCRQSSAGRKFPHLQLVYELLNVIDSCSAHFCINARKGMMKTKRNGHESL
jgi:hypothetical protein